MKLHAEPETFHVDFGCGTTCTARITEPPKAGTVGKVVFEWTGTPTQALFPAYRAWVHSLNEHLACKWQVRLMHVFAAGGGRYEAWIYAPGRPAERAK